MLVVDGAQYTTEDALGTLRAVAAWWEQLTAGRDTTATTAIGRGLVTELRGALGEPTGSGGLGPADGDLVAELDRLARLVERRLAGRAGGAADAALGHAALSASLRAFTAAGEALRAAGALPETATGTVVGLHVSNGGVPKRSIDHAVVGPRGLEGDRQASRRHHGRPWQAVCLWSGEVIDSFVAQGHRLYPGAAGENVTVRGLPWGEVRAGVRLRLGTVLVETTPFTLPCAKNAGWFADRDFNRMHHERGAVSRIYASVLEPGAIAVGDAAVLEPR
jgi:MOSC domain-containing protein YiiM